MYKYVIAQSLGSKLPYVQARLLVENSWHLSHDLTLRRITTYALCSDFSDRSISKSLISLPHFSPELTLFLWHRVNNQPNTEHWLYISHSKYQIQLHTPSLYLMRQASTCTFVKYLQSFWKVHFPMAIYKSIHTVFSYIFYHTTGQTIIWSFPPALPTLTKPTTTTTIRCLNQHRQINKRHHYYYKAWIFRSTINFKPRCQVALKIVTVRVSTNGERTLCAVGRWKWFDAWTRGAKKLWGCWNGKYWVEERWG